MTDRVLALLVELPARLRTLLTSLLTVLLIADGVLLAVISALDDDWPAGTSVLLRIAAVIAAAVVAVRTHMPAAKVGDPNGLLPTAGYAERLAQLNTPTAEQLEQLDTFGDDRYRLGYREGAQVAPDTVTYTADELEDR